MRTLLTTQNQDWYRETIMKEAYTRLAWKIKYDKDYPTKFPSRRSKPLVLFNPPATNNITLPPLIQPTKKKVEAPETPKSLRIPLMRPVSPPSKETLYHGLSTEGKGRSQYLKKRSQKRPEERFDYPILSSWEYGWRLGDYEQGYRSPVTNGRSEVVKSNFYARNGVFYIPSATDRLG